MPAARSLYEILQVDPSAEPEIVEAAYRRLARKYHPDVSSSDDTGRRMTEINGAYEVLRDPLRRAAYDRERLEQVDVSGRRDAPRQDDRPEPAPPPAADPWAPYAPASGMLGCRQHHGAVAVGTCDTCGAGLCGRCFDRFDPPSCPSCLLAWASERRWELRRPAIWVLAVAGVVACLVLASLGRVARSGPPVFALEALSGCVVACYPSGWRVMRHRVDTYGETLAGLLIAAAVGPVVAPFRMARIAWDLRQVRRLEALARDAGG
jgi:hypothetical protein